MSIVAGIETHSELVKLDVAAGATNTLRPLTHSLDLTKEGLAVDATHEHEEWRPIPGYEGIYEASDLGNIRGVDRIDARGWPRRGQPLAAVPHVHDEYLHVCLTKKGRHRTVKVHHLVLKTFVGPRPEGMQGCHNDGNRVNNRLSNLRWDTQSANQLDAVRHGTHALAARTHCKRGGHLLAEPNLCNYGLRQGVRACLACNKTRRYLAHHPEADWGQVAAWMYRRIMSGEFQQKAL